jgi:DNA-binding GntR family transcriptional regulator
VTGLALYDRVAQQLRDHINRGIWVAGQRIPTEAELTAEFKVSRVTLRKAIAALRDEGMLAVQQGVGTFVKHQRAAQELDRLETLNTTLINQGYEPVTHVVEFNSTRTSRCGASAECTPLPTVRSASSTSRSRPTSAR